MAVQGFLLDAHIPAAVVDGVRSLRSNCFIIHLAHWKEGAYRNAADEDILAAAHADHLVLVTYDRDTIPSIVHRWLAEGSVKQIAPACEIVHLADWRGGRYLHSHDVEILAEALVDDLVLVTHDTAAIPGLIHEWISQGRPTAGIAVITASHARTDDVGGLARSLSQLYANPQLLNPAYPVVYIRPIP